jgi:hypothetical protein
MKTKEEIIKKAIDKSLFKVRAKLLEVNQVNDFRWEFILWKQSSKEKIYFKFTTINHACIAILKEAAKNSRFKVKFKINAVQFKNSWYNNLIAVEIQEWLTNEDKIKKAEYMAAHQTKMFEEKKYNKSITNQNYQP